MSTAQREYIPGSDEDFEELYRSTYPSLLRALGLMLGDWAQAEDCVQDAYVRAYRAWSGWRPDAPAEAWLWRITLNVARTRMSQGKRWSVGEIVRRLGKPAAEPDPSTVVLRFDLRDALRRLRPREVNAVVLRYLHGHTNAEIALFLGVDVRTVTRLLTKGVEHLRADLGDAWNTVPMQPDVAAGGAS